MSDKRIKKSRGNRGSEEIAIKRRLLLLRRLLQGPVYSHELHTIFEEYTLRQGDTKVTKEELSKRFSHDCKRLKDWFDCEWDYDPKTTIYTLTKIDFALIDLSEEAVQGLAFLNANFSSPKILMGEEVRGVIEQITRIVPSETRKAITKRRKMIEMDLAVKDTRQISDKLWADIESTLGTRRLEIFYQASKDSQPWWYDIEPERWYAENGHLYLRGRCYAAHNPDKKDHESKHISFRVDRIHESRPLPDHFTPTRPRTTELEYILAPEIARGGISEHFKNQQIFYLDDGSVKVNVASENLFIDLRKLLHYGAMCKVIGGAEAIREMEKIIHHMAQLYTK